MAPNIGNYFNSVAASNAYHTTSYNSDVENAFEGASTNFGVGWFNFTGGGRVDGNPPTVHYVNSKGYTEVAERTLGINPYTGESGYGIFA